MHGQKTFIHLDMLQRASLRRDSGTMGDSPIEEDLAGLLAQLAGNVMHQGRPQQRRAVLALQHVCCGGPAGGHHVETLPR